MPMASLYAWNPHLDDRKADHKTIALLLSPFAGTDDIAPDRALSAEILSCLQLERQPVAWQVEPIRTSYFAAPDATGSERWRRVWSMTIEFDHGIEKVPELQREYFELTAGGAYVPGGSITPADTPYWVICDFQDAGSTNAATTAIRKHQPSAPLITVNLNDQFIQLQIDLGVSPPKGFATALDWATAAEQICRDHGGIPNNDEREEQWAVVFNEDGLAFDDDAGE